MENNKHIRPKKSSNFVVQGSILAVTAIIVRLIGIVYRLPLINIIGDEGMGYYTTAFNVYSIMLLLSSYSLPLAVSKMISARVARRQYFNSVRILKASMFYATIVGSAGAAIVWFGAEAYANAISAPYCAYALKSLAPTVWIMAYLGVLRGYFQGLGTMVPTALSQVLEQIVNAVVSVGAAYVLFQEGWKANLVHKATEFPNAFGAAGGTIGTGAGALSALLFLAFVVLIYRKTIQRQLRRERTRRKESYQQITLILCFTVIPVILSTAVYNVSNIIDNTLFGMGMDSLGKSEEFLSLWGVYSGKYHLLINVPMAIANALSSSLIPALSQAVSSRNRGQVIDKVTTAIRFSMVVAIPSTIGLTVLAGPVNNLLFPGGNNELAIQMTAIGSTAVVVFSLSTVTNAILQGINKMRIPIRNALISLVLHIIALEVMLLVLHWGVYSIVFANILFGVFMCLLNGMSIKHYLNYKQEFKKTFCLPLLASCIMGGGAYGIYYITHMLFSSNMISTLLAIFSAVIVYGVLLIKLRCVDEVELYHMPGGTRVIRLAKKLHLLS